MSDLITQDRSDEGTQRNLSEIKQLKQGKG